MNGYDWVILNQSLSPAFQHMMERLAGDTKTLLMTGTPFPAIGPRFNVERGPAYDRSTLGRRASSWLAFASLAAARLARVPGRPFVLAVTNPPMLPHLTWALAQARGLDYALLIWDIYPHHLVKLGLVQESSRVVRAWHALNRRALGTAKVVITLGDGMAETLRAELGEWTGAPDVTVVPNWADTEVFRPREAARQVGSSNPLTVMYSGNLGATHGLDALVAAAARLRDDPRFRFVIIGSGLGRQVLETDVAKHRLHNLELRDAVPWSEFPKTLASADIAVVSQFPGTEHLSVPSKTYTALAVGAAILALTREDSDLARLVRNADVGAVAAWNDPAGIADLLLGFANDRQRLAALRRSARGLAEREYSTTAVYRQFDALFAPYLNRRSTG